MKLQILLRFTSRAAAHLVVTNNSAMTYMHPFTAIVCTSVAIRPHVVLAESTPVHYPTAGQRLPWLR